VTEYDKYIRVHELLALQRDSAPGGLVNHDELMFQTVHQVAELWLKLALHEVRGAVKMWGSGDLRAATHRLRRAAEIERLLCAQMPLLELMPPKEYHAIRATLGRGSGQDSPGFNRLLESPSEVWPAFEALLRARGVTLIGIHRDPEAHPEMYALVAALMDLDEGFQRFRYNHFSLVRRIIGDQVKSLKGVPAAQLAQGTTEPMFPELWKTISTLTREHTGESQY
jgi:tryptophan 2,3-dioxygenase